MAGRGAVRSSARLSAEPAASAPAAPVAAPGPAGRAGRGRPLAGTAAAAQRRARAAERAREVEDSPRVLRDKCRRLARALRNAKHLVVYTGAGISTAADIPDYRGPDGVWTRLRRGEAPARVDVARARPTFTHMALSALWARGALKFVVSQNCDGLHLRAGLPRRALAELHGDMFAELCAACRRVYLRAFDTTARTARHRHATRRLCHACGAELRDSIVHFGERGRAAWPLNWAGALRHAARADVVLCLGSSLKVLRRYPRLWRMASAPAARPALYIVNLQWTPKDAVAALKINARCDAVMRELARRLRLRVPRYRASRDPVLAHAEPLAPPEEHTTRAPPAAPASPTPGSPTAPDYWEPSSPSASDSDEELPLRRLAERLRAPPSPPAPPPPPPPPAPDPLRAFQVSLQACEATILLRAEHAPSPASPAPRPSDLRRFRRVRPGAAPPAPPAPPALNGHAPGDARLEPLNGTAGLDSRLRRLLEYEPRIEAGGDAKRAPEHATAPGTDARAEGPAARAGPLGRAASPQWPESRMEFRTEPRTEPKTEPKMEPKSEPKSEPKIEPKSEPKIEPKIEPKSEPKKEPKTSPRPEPRAEPRGSDKARAGSEAGDSSGAESAGALAAGSLAAAIIRRAVLLCRASLYPGLHTILAPPPPAPPECAWCARVLGARRCLWYGPPRATPPAARAWRRVRGRRYLCACCGTAPEPSAPEPSPPDPGGGGWYGKGYRKGRRRR